MNTVITNRAKSYLENLDMTDVQRSAAAERERAVVVTAGAGSGKTRTLVARYLSLLADGLAPEALVAITFTEKAAREMRARVRLELRSMVDQSTTAGDKEFWLQLERRMDAARIGTIHSLCAEILRAHPAQAVIDPQFQVLDEGLAAIARADAVQTAMANAVNDPELLPLFENFSTRNLESLLGDMLEKRLDVLNWIKDDGDPMALVQIRLDQFINNLDQQQLMAELGQYSDQELSAETTAKGIEQVLVLRAQWLEILRLHRQNEAVKVVQNLQNLRHTTLQRVVGSKESRSKEIVQTWRNLYDTHILCWLGKEEVDADFEQAYAALIPLLQQLFTKAVAQYRFILNQEQALDFDDLENGALQLLLIPQVAAIWQSRTAALLVDEFQDTNQRQRRIVELLSADDNHKLFIVGDARQSIYRFRGADVTVFKDVQQQISAGQGLKLNLEHSFRTHLDLLQGNGNLLAGLMGMEEDQNTPYQVPFSPMLHVHLHPKGTVQSPYIEILMGAAEYSGSARQQAANLLAARLLEMKAAGEISQWQDVALLFRASTAFSIYENALEAAGIPYVTVAGSGFYDRPEIRDLLNMLKALADPWDDLAMVGLLRSPAVGMSDPGITRLRWLNNGRVPLSLSQALQQDLSSLNEADQKAAARAQQLITSLTPLVGMVPVAELLERIVSITFYRAILAGGQARGWRNLDKLLQDAASTGMVSVHAYLEYLLRIRAVGAREGEAPGEAEAALQLMTIHKAKGLEFPLVVLADAGRNDRNFASPWVLLPGLGAAFKPDRMEYNPLVLRYLKQLDSDMETAEKNRLLYVAMTRAEDKLIINGHLSTSRGKYNCNGWLKELLAVLDLDADGLMNGDLQQNLILSSGQELRISIQTDMQPFYWQAPAAAAKKQEATDITLAQPLKGPALEPATVETATLLKKMRDAPQSVVGKLLHLAVQSWRFPETEPEKQFLYRAALQFGLVDGKVREDAVQKVLRYLHRLQQHPLYEEIKSADERHHEVPYGVADQPDDDFGRLDILYRVADTWKIVDFKTDRIPSMETIDPDRRQRYRLQLERYASAVRQQLDVAPQAAICYLDVAGKIEIVSIP